METLKDTKQRLYESQNQSACNGKKGNKKITKKTKHADAEHYQRQKQQHRTHWGSKSKKQNSTIFYHIAL
jgi:hypothetical protein